MGITHVISQRPEVDSNLNCVSLQYSQHFCVTSIKAGKWNRISFVFVFFNSDKKKFILLIQQNWRRSSCINIEWKKKRATTIQRERAWHPASQRKVSIPTRLTPLPSIIICRSQTQKNKRLKLREVAEQLINLTDQKVIIRTNILSPESYFGFNYIMT